MNLCQGRIASLLTILLLPGAAYAQQISYVSQNRYVEGYDQVDFDNPIECRIDAADFGDFNAQCAGRGPSGTDFAMAAAQTSSLTDSGFVVAGRSAGDSFDGVGQSRFEVTFDVDSATDYELTLDNFSTVAYSRFLFVGPGIEYRGGEDFSSGEFHNWNNIPATGSLVAGRYTLEYVDAQGDSNEPYSLSFSVNTVPEPVINAPVLAILCMLCGRRRIRSSKLR